MTNAVVTGRYDDNWLAVVERQPPSGADGGPPVFERLVKVRARTLVVAPGLIERPYVFEGNDAGCAAVHGGPPADQPVGGPAGERAVVLTANAEGDAAVEDLGRAGVDVVRVVDGRNGGDVLRAETGGRGGATAFRRDARQRRADRLRPPSSPPSAGPRRPPS